MSAADPRPTPLARALELSPALGLQIHDLDLDLAVWRQRDRYYAIPPLRDPVLSIHVGGAGHVRFGDQDGWSRRTSSVGTVTYLPPGFATRWQVEGGAVEHLTVTTGPASSLRGVITDATHGLEVGMPDALNVSLAQTLIEVMASPRVHDDCMRLLIKSLCETLLRNFARLERMRYQTSHAGAASPCATTASAIRAIESRFAEPLLVSELATEAGLSPPYFSELFKKGTGLTPHQYLLRVRIERVCAALRATDIAVASIAHNFGFSSQSHLNAVFRKIVGITPSQYRHAPDTALSQASPP